MQSLVFEYPIIENMRPVSYTATTGTIHSQSNNNNNNYNNHTFPNNHQTIPHTSHSHSTNTSNSRSSHISMTPTQQQQTQITRNNNIIKQQIALKNRYKKRNSKSTSKQVKNKSYTLCVCVFF